MSIRFCTVVSVALLATVGTLATPARGEVLGIQLLDVDLLFIGDSGTIADGAGVVGGDREPAFADSAGVVQFEPEDGVPTILPAQTSSVDFKLQGLPSTLPLTSTGVATYSLFGDSTIDWFSGNGNYLTLQLDSIDIDLTRNYLLLTASAEVVDQNLPADLEIGSKVSFSYSATLPAVQQLGQTTAMATASGVMTVSGAIIIPEPAAFLLALGGFALALRR